MTETIELVFLVILVAALTAVATFSFVWLFWLRSVRESITETQVALKEAKGSIEKYIAFQQTMMGPPPPVPLMDEMGAEYLEGEIDDMIIRLPPDVSPQERERIIHYLKSEGFISDEK